MNIFELLKNEKVEWKKLGEVCQFNKGQSITKKEVKEVKEGNVPVVAGGKKPAYYHNKSNRNGNTVAIAASGTAGYVSWWDVPIFLSDAYSVEPKADLDKRYLYHCLLNIQNKIYELKEGTGTPHVYSRDLALLKIPVPSVETQKKIVEILDKFTEYVTELQAELQDRTLQYNYYRDKLLSEKYLDRKQVLSSTSNKIVWKSIKEICTFRRGQSITFKDVVEGNVPVISGGQKPAYYHNVSNRVGKTIAIAGSGVNAGYVSYWEIPVFLNDAFSIEPFSDIDTKYLYYFLQSQQNKIYSFKKGSGVPHVYGEDIGTLKIVIPPPAIQQKVVNILDKFQDILKDTEGLLPTEIEQRQKQYEYYREKLLTFGIESGTASQPASQPASHKLY